MILEFTENREDNFWDYGVIRCLSSQFVNKESKISLEAFCKAKNFKETEFWLSLNRESYDLAGVGKTKYLHGNSKFKVLNKECPYAVQIVEGGGIFKQKCKLSNEEISKLKAN